MKNKTAKSLLSTGWLIGIATGLILLFLLISGIKSCSSSSSDSPSAEAQGSSQNQSKNSYPTQGEKIATKTNPVRVYVDTQKNTKIDIMDNDIKIGEGALYTREDGLVSPVKITRGGTEQIHITQSGVYILTPINRTSIKVRWGPG